MNFVQSTFQVVGAAKGQFMARIIPLVVAVLVVAGAYDVVIYHGLNDAQSMDNAQLARQIARRQGFTTEFIRPQALTQLHNYEMNHGTQAERSADLFPADRFPAGVPRILPDTYNAPGYPCLLAAYFHLIRPDFYQSPGSIYKNRVYAGDQWIPLLNQGFMLLTAMLVFALGCHLFDERVAWLSVLAFLGTDLVWHYTLTALSTSVLMFLVTALFLCVLEIYSVGEACFKNEDRSFGPAWLWGFLAALLLAAACLTRLHLLVLLIPLFVVLIVMPRRSFPLLVVMTFVVLGLVAPWFYWVYTVSGNPLGSNFALLLYGQGDYSANQIYCATSIPSYEHLFSGVGNKEYSGFLWHFERGWDLLGVNPFVLFFGASILHRFKRRQTQAFHWLLFGSAVLLIAANNFGVANPKAVDAWNTLVVLFPCMVVIGCAFFSILLDRLNLQIRLLRGVIVTATVALTVTPMVLSLTGDNATYSNYPPYFPAAIKAYGQYAQPDEWITTDMPWATAWYADRASLWLPDSLSDFENLHDDVCPTGLLLLTPVTWSEPFSTFSTGEYKDWYTLVSGIQIPSGFPLVDHTAVGAGSLDYSLWSDRARWQTQQ
ncbi:MAG: hypothetical protein LV480_09745 [Methylacidiphilales bacterium]|nr:hypothetical protein [Candidatus Methylacidiphilales bacterium]